MQYYQYTTIFKILFLICFSFQQWSLFNALDTNHFIMLKTSSINLDIINYIKYSVYDDEDCIIDYNEYFTLYKCKLSTYIQPLDDIHKVNNNSMIRISTSNCIYDLYKDNFIVFDLIRNMIIYGIYTNEKIYSTEYDCTQSKICINWINNSKDNYIKIRNITMKDIVNNIQNIIPTIILSQANGEYEYKFNLLLLENKTDGMLTTSIPSIKNTSFSNILSSNKDNTLDSDIALMNNSLTDNAIYSMVNKESLTNDTIFSSSMPTSTSSKNILSIKNNIEFILYNTTNIVDYDIIYSPTINKTLLIVITKDNHMIKYIMDLSNKVLVKLNDIINLPCRYKSSCHYKLFDNVLIIIQNDSSKEIYDHKYLIEIWAITNYDKNTNSSSDELILYHTYEYYHNGLNDKMNMNQLVSIYQKSDLVYEVLIYNISNKRSNDDKHDKFHEYLDPFDIVVYELDLRNQSGFIIKDYELDQPEQNYKNDKSEYDKINHIDQSEHIVHDEHANQVKQVIQFDQADLVDKDHYQTEKFAQLGQLNQASQVINHTNQYNKSHNILLTKSNTNNQNPYHYAFRQLTVCNLNEYYHPLYETCHPYNMLYDIFDNNTKCVINQISLDKYGIQYLIEISNRCNQIIGLDQTCLKCLNIAKKQISNLNKPSSNDTKPNNMGTIPKAQPSIEHQYCQNECSMDRLFPNRVKNELFSVPIVANDPCILINDCFNCSLHPGCSWNQGQCKALSNEPNKAIIKQTLDEYLQHMNQCESRDNWNFIGNHTYMLGNITQLTKGTYYTWKIGDERATFESVYSVAMNLIAEVENKPPKISLLIRCCQCEDYSNKVCNIKAYEYLFPNEFNQNISCTGATIALFIHEDYHQLSTFDLAVKIQRKGFKTVYEGLESLIFTIGIFLGCIPIVILIIILFGNNIIYKYYLWRRRRNIEAMHELSNYIELQTIMICKDMIQDLKCTKYDSNDGIDFNQKQCVICFQDFQHDEEINTLLCKHIFHDTCLKNWIMISKKNYIRCPVCNLIINYPQTKFIDIYPK